MILFNDRKEHEIRHDLNPFDSQLNDETRFVLFRASKKQPVARFIKWIVIGSFTAIGMFDLFTWDATQKMYRVDHGYVEKSLKGDRYDTFGKGFALTVGSYGAWGTGGTNTWTVPSDWNAVSNWIDCIAGGGNGSLPFGGDAGGGGGGGGYCRRNNVSLSRGTTVYMWIANQGQNTWFNITGSNSQPGAYNQGLLATPGGNGSYLSGGGGGGAYYGDVQYSGGNGGWIGGHYGNGCGGGGAGGVHGNAGTGSGGVAGNSYMGGGGGGGGGGNGSEPNGGNNWLSYGGGGQSGDGSSGGGGGGGWYTNGGSGGNGGNGIEYNNSAWGSGGGGGGGGRTASQGCHGGNGGWAGGGGGGGAAYGGGGNSGLVVAYWEPAKGNFIPGPSFAGY